MKMLTIRPNDAGQRLDKFLRKALPLMPPAYMYKAIRKKDIRLNGSRCESSAILREGDVLRLFLPEEFFEVRDKLRFLAAPSLLNIVYEDDHLLLLNKPAGLLVHDDDDGETDTLLSRLLHTLYDRGAYHPDDEQSFAPALCNRIDRNTSGIVIAAKNAEALRVMNEKIKNREVEKRYLCVVCGVPQKKEALLTAYHRKDAAENLVTISDRPLPGYKEIKTRYRVLQVSESGRFSLIEVELITGRTHQIRAQMAKIGHPLLGDTKYGNGRLNREMGMDWQALSAYRITFRFSDSGGALGYINGQSFEVGEIPFRDRFREGLIN